MIRTQEMVPDWYIEKSRDFQVLCRLYDFTLNALKYNINTMQSLTDTKSVKDTALPLVGDKFGIYDKEAASNRQLLDALPGALRDKGSLQSVTTLLNAFMESLDVFDYVLAFHSKDKKSAAELSELLRRDVQPYSIIIVLSTFPSLSNLHILDEYLKMVIPTGMIVEYMFGLEETSIETFKYNEHVFLFYTQFDTDNNNYPYISYVKQADEEYSFEYVGEDEFIESIQEAGVDINTVSTAMVYGDK